jgi:Tfp pilus assembly protein FimT
MSNDAQKVKIRKNFLKGFTMIEILIVVSIAMVMTVVLFNAKNDDSSSKEVDAAAQQIVAELRALQSDALNGKEIGGEIVYKFKVGPGSDDTTYQVSYVNKADGNIGAAITSAKLKGVGVNFESGQPVIFTSPRGEASGSNKLTIYAGDSLVSASVKSFVMISSSGNIEVSKTGAFAATSCIIPGHTILSGDSLIGYSASSVACGQSCNAISAMRVCVNGTLSNDMTFSSDSCTPDPCPCNLNGTLVASGNSILAANPISVPCGTLKCDTKLITCNDGTFSDLTYGISAADASCMPDACQVCTGGTYDANWGACVSDGSGGGVQYKNLIAGTNTPLNCVGGSVPATISQTCTYVAPATCSGWTEVPPCVNYDSSGVCLDSTTLVCTANCADGLPNGNETGVDCGGSCGACPPPPPPPPPATCSGYDCISYDASGSCIDSVCSGYCGDGIKNGYETATDCGGGLCAACASPVITWTRLSGSYTGDSCFSSDVSLAGTACSNNGEITYATGGCWWDNYSQSCPDYNCDQTETLVCGVQQTCTAGVYGSLWPCQPSGTTWQSLVGTTPANCVGGGPFAATINNQACVYTTPPTCSGYDSSNNCLGYCNDGFLNGEETAVDCGGSYCSACAAVACTSANYDANWGACQSNNTQTKNWISNNPAGCTSGSFAATISQGCTYVPPATCSGYDCISYDASGSCIDSVCSGYCGDGIKNGYETATDCGGGLCQAC